MAESSPKPNPIGRTGKELKYRLRGYATAYDYQSILAQLGKVPDCELAAQLGCHPSLIWRLRKRLNISRYCRAAAVDHLLGKCTDRQLARHLSVNPSTISHRRKALRIPPANVARANAAALLRDYMNQLDEQLES